MLLGGKTVFPITLGNGPPLTSKDPVTGLDGWKEVAQAGVKMLRVYPKWTAANAAQQIQAVKEQLLAAAQHGLWLWVGLYNLANDLGKQPLLEQVVDAFKDLPGLGAWKGADEPLHANLPAQGLVDAYNLVHQHDPNHPLVLIQAPVARNGPLTTALLEPYAAAGDIHGVDIYPVSFPPGAHAGRPNKDISVVGDVTDLVVQAAPGKEHWTTLQIAWSGVLPPQHVPTFPGLREERFMAYQAIVAGANGLVFFGGDLTPVMSPADAAQGWNWTFWHTVLKPLVQQLHSTAVGPALLAPASKRTITADSADVRLSAREADGFLYVIAVRQDPTKNSDVTLSGLPAAVKSGQALFEYDHANFRTVTLSRGAFTDPFAPHDARVYRFRLP